MIEMKRYFYDHFLFLCELEKIFKVCRHHRTLFENRNKKPFLKNCNTASPKAVYNQVSDTSQGEPLAFSHMFMYITAPFYCKK